MVYKNTIDKSFLNLSYHFHLHLDRGRGLWLKSNIKVKFGNVSFKWGHLGKASPAVSTSIGLFPSVKPLMLSQVLACLEPAVTV